MSGENEGSGSGETYICDPIRASSCKRKDTHCYIRLWGTDKRCVCTPHRAWARERPDGSAILATPELIEDYRAGRAV